MPVRAFIRQESGTVAVDWVVLTASAAAMAGAAYAVMALDMRMLNEDMAGQMQERESRPAFAYMPYDAEAFTVYVKAFGSLEDAELDAVSALLNGMRDGRGAASNAERAAYDDLDEAVDKAYAARLKERPGSTAVDGKALDQAVARLADYGDPLPASAFGG